MRRVAVVAAAALLAVGGVLPAAGAAHAADLVTVQMPGPGHRTTWSTTVQNPASSTATVVLAVADVGGPASQLDDELQVSVRVDGATVIAQTPLRRLTGGAPVPLGTVAAGGAKTVSGDVLLSSAAGNDYQGLSAQFTLRLSSVESQAPPPLADTGLTVIGVGVPLALIALGVLLRLRRRKPREQL
ncbi:hypothetical protein [Leifsonia shinshuensis]|uniref:LPXTG cell wall anchor domain-containing protein n=1 Tax=Leifsonia shinshuensis TaxID=150026 RepID=A0A853CZH2_9MICO|nr:hypothetical protein [Leifsonia shinshuensis]NYJ24200.1 hypothetical protein [Leifsonia shinshuensis]